MNINLKIDNYMQFYRRRECGALKRIYVIYAYIHKAKNTHIIRYVGMAPAYVFNKNRVAVNTCCALSFQKHFNGRKRGGWDGVRVALRLRIIDRYARWICKTHSFLRVFTIRL